MDRVDPQADELDAERVGPLHGCHADKAIPLEAVADARQHCALVRKLVVLECEQLAGKLARRKATARDAAIIKIGAQLFK